MREIFRMRVSRTAVINSTNTVARPTKNVSEAPSFAPTTAAAEIVLQILDTIKKVDETDEVRIRLIKRVVDFLLLLREHFDDGNEDVSRKLAEKIQEFELILLSIHDNLKPEGKKSFECRAFNKEKVRKDLDRHAAVIESEIETLNLNLLLWISATTQTNLRAR